MTGCYLKRYGASSNKNARTSPSNGQAVEMEIAGKLARAFQPNWHEKYGVFKSILKIDSQCQDDA